MHFVVVVQATDELQDLGFRRVCGQLELFGVHPDLKRLLGLIAHIDLAGRVVSDNDHGQARGDAVLRLESLDVPRNPFPQAFGKGFSVDDLGGHEHILLAGGGPRYVRMQT
jgi:hypothetical protein